MNFSFTEDQLAIQSLANQIFTDQATDESLLNFSRTEATYDDALWQSLAEQGLLAVSLPENLGGSDLGFVELCLILEEQGRRVAPVPLFSSLILAALPLLEFASEELQQQWLKPLALGTVKLTAATTQFASDAALPIISKAGVLSGVQPAVLDGSVANAILIPAIEDNGDVSFYLIDTASAGVKVSAQHSFNGETFATITLDQVPGSLVGKKGQGNTILQWLEPLADVAIAALQQGVCDEAVKRTAAFTGERTQFGTAIGTFQAVAMRAADAYIDCEAMRSAYWGALWRVAEGLDARAESRVAKYWACQGAHKVVHACQHLHGGIGADVEYPIHRFFIFAKQLSFISGSSAIQLKHLGELLASNDEAGLSSLSI